MNKIIISALLVMFISCSKSNEETLKTEKESELRIESISENTDVQSRIVMFNLLTNQEKYSMWIDHLNKAKNQFIVSGELTKVTLLQELINNFNLSLYDEASQSSDIFLNYFIPLWYERAKLIFSYDELYDISNDPTVDIIGMRAAPPEIGNELPGGIAGCFCNVGTSGFSCRRIELTLPPSITNGICERTNAACLETRRGCGWFWLHRCDGNHCQF